MASQQPSPALQVKRRIANRESARRVQQRRKEIIEDLQIKVGAVRICGADLPQIVYKTLSINSCLVLCVPCACYQPNKATSACLPPMPVQVVCLTAFLQLHYYDCCCCTRPPQVQMSAHMQFFLVG